DPMQFPPAEPRREESSTGSDRQDVPLSKARNSRGTGSTTNQMGRLFGWLHFVADERRMRTNDMHISRSPTQRGSSAGQVRFTPGTTACVGLTFMSPPPAGCGCDDECSLAAGFAPARARLSPEAVPGTQGVGTASTRPMRPRHWPRVLTPHSAPDLSSRPGGA